MNRTLLALALSFTLCFPALAQNAQPAPTPPSKPAMGDTGMPMSGDMMAMSGEQMQKMHDMMGKMMPMMQRMQDKAMTPAQRAEMMKQMAPMMQSMMPMMMEMMKGGSMMPSAGAAASPSTAAFEAAMMKMEAGMAISYTGDADRDFATGMIPHHEGAVAMANVLLQYGKSPEMRKLAEDIVKGQAAEIAMMREFLAKKAQ